MKRTEGKMLDFLRIVVTTLLFLGFIAGTVEAANPQQAGVDAVAAGDNITLNVSTATSVIGSSITVTVNMSNITADDNIFYINVTESAIFTFINVTGAPTNGPETSDGALNTTIKLNSTNGSFTLDSPYTTDYFNVTVSNPNNTAENATLTGFRFVDPASIGLTNTTVYYNNGSIPTSIPTYVYYFFNGSSINLTVTTIAKMDNVTADYSNVSGGTGYNATGFYNEGYWIYNITNATATSAPDANVSLINISLTMNGIPISVTVPFIALMNFNPRDMDATLADATTNWSTEIPDFTNVTGLTFEKVESGSLGKIVFTSSINLSNTTTALALASLGQNLYMSRNNMSLNTAADALFALNVSANLTLYNLSFSSFPAIFSSGQKIVTPGNSSGGDVTDLIYDEATKSLTFSVEHWSDYTIFGLENVSATAYANGTDNFTMRILGTPNMNVTIDSNRSQDEVNGVAVPQYIMTDANGTAIFNITSTVGGYANITATNDSIQVNNTNVFFYSVILDSIVVAPSEATLIVGGTQAFNATALNDTTPMSGVNVSWTVINETVGSVSTSSGITDAYGNVTVIFTASEAGTTLVNATNGSINGSASVTAVPPTLTSIVVSPSEATLIVGGTQAFNATALNDTTPMSGVNVSWTVINETVGSVPALSYGLTDAYGNVTIIFTASEAGTTLVNATNGTVNGSASVTVSSAPVYGVNLSVSGLATGTTNATVNKTYTLLLQNNGTVTDTYNLTVDSVDASTAALNVSGNITLGSMETRTILLNVTNTATGTAYANVTAQSLNDSSKIGYINTTTTITAAPDRNVTLTIDPVSASASTRPGVNATYTLNLTNTGNSTDTYTLVLDGDTTASVNATSITSIDDLASGASRIFLLNVTNTTQGVFHINVTATSSDLITSASVNTTTSVILDQPDVAASYWGYVVINQVLSSAYISVHGSNGTEVANTTSASNGTYQVAVPWDDIYTPADEGVVSGETITFNVNNISVLSRTIAIANSGNNTRLDLPLYNGTIIGSVLKATTGLGIDGATVTITNATLGLSVTTTTNSLGSYSAPVFPATYNISVTKAGYLSNTTTTGKIVYTNTSTAVAAILLSPSTVTVTANRTVGSADAGQNVTFNLTVVNTGDDATFSVVTSVTNVTIATNTTTPSPLLLNATTSTGNVIVEVNNNNLGGWPVTVTVRNATQSKTASITLNAIMRDSSVANTTINSTVNNSNVTGGAYLENTIVDNSTVANATLINATVQNNATISGNSTLITHSTITGQDTVITDGSIIKGTYVDSYIDNSTIGSATVDSSNLTGSTIGGNASITNSTLIDATVTNSTLTNVTVSSESSITNVAGLDNITIGGVTITGQAAYDFEGMISATTTGWVTYQTIYFTKVYEAVRISQLVIEQSDNIPVQANISTAINDTTPGVSRNISMNVTANRSMAINISETFISPDGAGLGSGKIGNYLVIRSNDTSNVTNHTLRLYLDTNPANYSSVKIYYYNTTAATPAWEALTTTASGNESGRWYLEAAPNHFSTFALLGTTTTTTPPGDGGSSGGGGGGGGGGRSGENVSNIEVIEKYDLQISKDALTAYRFTDERNPIMYVNITGNTTLGIITTSVEVLKNTSTLVSFPPEGLVYKNANIWVGTAGFATSKNIRDALIKFRIENSWMSENRVQNSAIVLEKWDGSSWIQLETKFVSKDDTYSIFEGRTNSFSPFAIVAKSGGQATPTVISTPAGTPTPGPTGKPGPGDEGGFPTWVIGLIILVIIGAAAYYFLVVKKNE